MKYPSLVSFIVSTIATMAAKKTLSSLLKAPKTYRPRANVQSKLNLIRRTY